jgi:hypothetical protein
LLAVMNLVVNENDRRRQRQPAYAFARIDAIGDKINAAAKLTEIK